MNVSISSLSGSSWAGQAQASSNGDARLERLFNKFDSDGDGTISKDELSTAQANAKEGSRDAELLSSLTTDSNGGVSLEDFKSQAKALFEQKRGQNQAGGAPPPPPDASEMFGQVDSNGDSSLSTSELEDMAANGPEGGPSASKMLDEMDTNKDGTVSEAEFKAHMEKMQSQMTSGMGQSTQQTSSSSSTTTSSSDQLAQLLVEALKSYNSNQGQSNSSAWSLLTGSSGSSMLSGGLYA
jgi:Ca2+-binding EF-hand superfamily protein